MGGCRVGQSDTEEGRRWEDGIAVVQQPLRWPRSFSVGREVVGRQVDIRVGEGLGVGQTM